MNNDQLTPGPWRWKFVSNAGNYFLVGNDGNGPITHSGPDSADGRLKQAAPSLLALCEASLHYIGGIPINKIDYRDANEILDQLAAAIDEAKGSDTPPRGTQRAEGKAHSQGSSQQG